MVNVDNVGMVKFRAGKVGNIGLVKVDTVGMVKLRPFVIAIGVVAERQLAIGESDDRS